MANFIRVFSVAMAAILCSEGIIAERAKRLSSLAGMNRSAANPIKIVEEAVKKHEMEEKMMHVRLDAGIDTLVPAFKTIVPKILGAGEHGFSVIWIAKQSRVINWIAAISRRHGSSISLEKALKTWVARFRKVYCPFFGPSKCVRGKYRTVDGTCNNLNNPLWGRGFIPLLRLLPPVYESEDGNVDIPRHDLPRRTGVKGRPLPSARLVSNVVHTDGGPVKPTRLTMEYTSFGQFLAHDLTDTPMESGVFDSKLNCCDKTKPTRRCFNIPLPDNDFFRVSGRTCFEFVRSTESTDISCKTGQREQLNIASSFIDGTGIYGHNTFEARSLRTFTGGLLLMSGPNELSFKAHPNKKAFAIGINFLKAGDEKVNEFIGLTAVTTLFYREHNRIAQRLAAIRPHYRDETLYQEARRIVIAISQHITYAEYIPVTLGRKFMDKYKLNLQHSGYFTGYDPNINPGVLNSFATGTFRFGHSMVRSSYHLVDKLFGTSSSNPLRLKNIFFRPSFYLLYENLFQRGVLTDPSEKCDRFMASDLRDHMFETKPGNGLDLASMNIQRGRDHGLPTYNEFRKYFNLNEATHWNTDPTVGFKDMTINTVNKFKQVYGYPEDVDLWTGGVSEIPIPNGATGPLFAEMMGLQFKRLREGDRHWYECAENGLTQAQLDNIRSTATFAKIICNGVDVETIQKRVFEMPTTGGSNDRVSCKSLPDLDLSLW